MLMVIKSSMIKTSMLISLRILVDQWSFSDKILYALVVDDSLCT